MYKLKLFIISGLFFIPVFDLFALDLTLNDAIDKILSESQDIKKAEATEPEGPAPITATSNSTDI